jgi:hypothetical protein
MKLQALAATLLIFAAGCAAPSSNSNKLQFRHDLTVQEKTGLISALQDGIRGRIYEINCIQTHLAELPYAGTNTNEISHARDLYKSGGQSRDLDQMIQILSEASDKLAVINDRIYRQLSISQGPY